MKPLALATGEPFVAPSRAPEVQVKHDSPWWKSQAHEFYDKFIKVDIAPIMKRFHGLDEAPWGPGVMPIVDPGKMSTLQVIRLALAGQDFKVWEGPAGRIYGGSAGNEAPSLCFVSDAEAPTIESLGHSPEETFADKKTYLSTREYIFMAGLYHFATGKPLDKESVTIFPDRLPGPGLRRSIFGCYVNDDVRREIHFGWRYASEPDPMAGAREVIVAKPLK